MMLVWKRTISHKNQQSWFSEEVVSSQDGAKSKLPRDTLKVDKIYAKYLFTYIYSCIKRPFPELKSIKSTQTYGPSNLPFAGHFLFFSRSSQYLITSVLYFPCTLKLPMPRIAKKFELNHKRIVQNSKNGNRSQHTLNIMVTKYESQLKILKNKKVLIMEHVHVNNRNSLHTK